MWQQQHSQHLRNHRQWQLQHQQHEEEQVGEGLEPLSKRRLAFLLQTWVFHSPGMVQGARSRRGEVTAGCGVTA